MPQAKNVVVWTGLGTVLSVIVPVIGTGLAALLCPQFRWSYLPLHSLVEGAGGITALAIARVLLLEREHKSDTGHYPLMSCGFLSMGIFDVFHAASMPGNHFVWLHTLATFSGGIFFGLLWIAQYARPAVSSQRLTVGVTAICLAIAAASLLASESLPKMKGSDDQFTAVALALNMLGGIGFLIGGYFFARRFWKTSATEDWLFAVQATLFGSAGVLFAFSAIWDAAWWWWHLLRLLAYIAAISYGFKSFRDAEREMRRINERLFQANATLDRTVEERTAKLRATEERFELAVRGSTDGIWDWNIPTSEVFFSPRFKELVGFSDDEFPNVFASFETRLHPEDHDRIMREIDAHLNNQKPYDVNYRLLTKAGEYRWYRARGQAVWGTGQMPERMAGSITDVTEEYQLRERFRLAVEASPAALMMVHRNGTILMANSRSLSMFGYTHSELVGQSVELLVPPQYRAGHPDHRENFFRSPTQRVMGANQNLFGVRRDGTEFPVQVGLSPVETAEGQAVICGIMDITDQMNMLAAMRQAKEAAESASRAKSSFLANMSHEIRTPMNGIIGMAQLLSQTELRSHQRDYLNTIEESAHVLLRLLNDILDFSKIEAGKLELEAVDFRLSECVTHASQLFSLRTAEKGLEIVCRIAPEIPNHLRGDPGRTQQVLVNLIGNAVKFTEVGEIFVNVNVESMSDDSVRLHFTVRDSGIGIAAEKLEQIFRPFEQAESSTTRRFGGSGLGLAISRQLVELMQGKIWSESEVGRGSTFHFTAEFTISADQPLHQSADLVSLQNLPVLVVDDNFTNRRILCEMLHYWRMQPVLTDSAAAARQALKKAFGSESPIGLILLDHHMPGEDGFDFVASLSGVPDRPPIIMISSGSTPVDPELCAKYGIQRFMNKPVIASELLNEILRQFGRSPEEKPNSPVLPQPSVQPRRVLLVEDNEINRRVAVGMLQSRGHQFQVAENGLVAVELLAQQEFDVVLMDMQMPVMDGYEATTEIRSRERQTGGHIPIVAMTAEALKGDREHCLAHGMDDYVSKPISRAELYRAIESFPAVCLASATPLIERAATILTHPSRSDQPRPLEPLANLDHTAETPAINWQVANELLPGGTEMLHEFVALVKTETPALLANIRHAIETGDFKLLTRSAHTLKSSVSYFGAEALSQAALALENLGRSETLERVVEMLAVLEQELARFLEALDSQPEGVVPK